MWGWCYTDGTLVHSYKINRDLCTFDLCQGSIGAPENCDVDLFCWWLKWYTCPCCAKKTVWSRVWFFLRSVVHTLNHTFCSSNHTSKNCDECKVWTCDLKVWITKNIKGDHMCDNTYKCVI